MASNELNINQTIGWQITKKNADLFVKLKNKHIDLVNIKSKVKKSIFGDKVLRLVLKD